MKRPDAGGKYSMTSNNDGASVTVRYLFHNNCGVSVFHSLIMNKNKEIDEATACKWLFSHFHTVVWKVCVVVF